MNKIFLPVRFDEDLQKKENSARAEFLHLHQLKDSSSKFSQIPLLSVSFLPKARLPFRCHR